MSKFRHRFTALRLGVAAAVSLAGAATATAGELGVNGNTVNVSIGDPNAAQPAGFPKAVSINSNGILDTVANIPNTPGGLNFPTFSFTLEASSVTNGTYVFDAGIMIDDDSSDRRLEIFIPDVTMVFSNNGGTLVGSVGNNPIIASGRNVDGSISFTAINVVNDLAGFDGSTLAFDAAEQITALQNGGGVLADITSTISTVNDYSYAVVLKQKTGPETLEFGLNARSSFDSFSCVAGSDVFIIDSENRISGQFPTANANYGLQGQFNFDGSSTGSLSPFDVTCAEDVAVVTPPVPGDPDPVDEVTDDIENVVVPTDASPEELANVANDLDAAVDNAAATAANVIASLNSGGTNTQEALDIIEALSTSLSRAGDITAAGGDVDSGTINESTQLIASVLEALPTTLTPAQKTQVATLTQTALTNTQRTIDSTLNVVETRQLTRNLSSVLAASAAASGDLSDETISTTRAIQQSLIQETLAQTATKVGATNGDGSNITFVDEAATETLLSGNPTLLSEVVNTVGITVPGAEVDDNGLLEATSTATDGGDTAETVGVRVSFIFYDFYNAEDETFYETVAGGCTADNIEAFITKVNGSDDALEFAGCTEIAELTFEQNSEGQAQERRAASVELEPGLVQDDVSGVLTASVNSGDISFFIEDQLLLPAGVPNGVFTRPNGSVLTVGDGFATATFPASRDLIGFLAGVLDADSEAFSIELASAGRMLITDTASNALFSASFTLDPVDTSVTGSGEISFAGPDAAAGPTQAGHVWQVTYADGTSQSLTPMMSTESFFDSVAAFGFGITTDRSTGIIDIDGAQFRPSFYVFPLSTEDQAYLDANGDAEGVAYRSGDVNGDGFTDYEVVTSAGVQLVYGLN